MLKKTLCALALISCGLYGTVNAGGGTGENAKTKNTKRAEAPVEIKIAPWGQTPEDVERAKTQLLASTAVRKELNGTKNLLLSFEYVENENKKQPASVPPTKYRAVFYDYTNDRTLVAAGSFDGADAITIYEDNFQPNTSPEEYDQALGILKNDAEIGAALRSQTIRAFAPMPPTTVLDGTAERLVNVGLASFDAATSNSVIGVSLKRGVVVRYTNNAPPTSKAAPEACGIPSAGQASSSRGTAGQYQMSVTQNGTALWDFIVIRPSASSGTNASGIEIRDVKYRGKSVLKRGHAPILNVQYVAGAGCGPYRDWQYQEDQFQVPTGYIEPVSGIAIAAPGTIPTTALESGNDTGNFRGVAVYTQNNETVLITEMQAGWYRYIMEWRLANDGTIRPRFGFGATNSSCVCSVHTHHVYWRLDFDIVQPNNKVFQVERGRRFLTPIATETKKLRNYGTNRSLLIQNGSGDEAYMLVPNITDGVTDTFGNGDMWVLKYKNVNGGTVVQNELDDGINCVTCSTAYIQVDQFLNNESIDNQDVVVWYGSHFIHSDGSNLLDPDRSGKNILSGAHVVGPDIRPVRW